MSSRGREREGDVAPLARSAEAFEIHVYDMKLVSYPDPSVRNDDYRLQYNVTYSDVRD